MYLPTDLANQALDSIGCAVVLGDLEDGVREAQVCLRNYRESLLQVLRVAHWGFARKQVPLLLLGDATGQTANVGTAVAPPWIYAYALPDDCAALRFIPHQMPPSSGTNNVPMSTAFAIPPGQFQPLRPARFLVARSTDYPPQTGQTFWESQGVSPQGRTVILTNVQNASAVYTSVTLYPSEFDPLFRNAFVAHLASKIALPLTKDRKLGLEIRREQIAILKSALDQARVANANEAGWNAVNLQPDWISFRNGGSANMRSLLGGEHAYGDWIGGFGPILLADGATY